MRRVSAVGGAALWFVLAPCVVAGLVPWLITRWRPGDIGVWWLPMQVLGGVLIVAGSAVIVHAFARFVSEGRGTPAPIAPPERLVVGGLYRYVRNPMYVAVVAVIVGQILQLARFDLLWYAAAVVLSVTAFVVLYEEPELSHPFGPEYAAYRQGVGRWLPRLRPWRPS
ncbi:MAG: isoprenylcysteine carboxyl methyltransferase [Micromonosporaceae bacterium]|nr:isoprenylcysteine carboxyl methyltransferase [Micromonosporaceae bacterium]